MDNDFLIDATPAVARKLVKLSNIMDINLDDEIRKLATENLIDNFTFEKFQIEPSERQIAQELIDNNFRSIFVHSDKKYLSIIPKVAKMMDIFPITFQVAETVYFWKKYYESMGENISFEPSNKDDDSILFLPIPTGGKNLDLSSKRRSGLFISDQCDSPNMENYAVEFPKSIILLNNKKWYYTSNPVVAANIMFRNTPSKPLQNSTYHRKRVLEERGFKKNHPTDLAFLYNLIECL